MQGGWSILVLFTYYFIAVLSHLEWCILVYIFSWRKLNTVLLIYDGHIMQWPNTQRVKNENSHCSEVHTECRNCPLSYCTDSASRSHSGQMILKHADKQIVCGSVCERECFSGMVQKRACDMKCWQWHLWVNCVCFVLNSVSQLSSFMNHQCVFHFSLSCVTVM